MSDLGPGTYDIPDDWMRSNKPVCGTVRPSSFMMSTSKKGAPIRPAGGQVNHDTSTSERDGCRPINTTGNSLVDNRPHSKSISYNPSRSGSRAKSGASGFSFPKGDKTGTAHGPPSSPPVYHIRVRDVRTGASCIMQVNSLSDPPPEGYLHQEVWANECIDGGASLTLKKEPLPPLNPLAHDISLSIPDVALVPMPVTPLKKSRPCHSLEVKQLHLTSGTDVLYISPAASPQGGSGGGGYLSAATHSLSSTQHTSQRASQHTSQHASQHGSAQQSIFESTSFDASAADGVVNWNHPISKLHIPTLSNQTSLSRSATHRPKTQGQKHMEEQSRKSKNSRRQSAQAEEPISGVTSRNRPNGEKFKKIPMHIADVASIHPSTTTTTGSIEPAISDEELSVFKSASAYREDSLGTLRNVGFKLGGSRPLR
jgi:hypothetical protein